MKKKRTAVIAVTFFLLQIIPLAGITAAESLSPNLLTKICTSAPGLQLKEACNVLFMALSLYRPDAFAGCAKGVRRPRHPQCHKVGALPGYHQCEVLRPSILDDLGILPAIEWFWRGELFVQDNGQDLI